MKCPSALLDTNGINRGGSFCRQLSNTTGYADVTVAFNPTGHNLIANPVNPARLVKLSKS